MSTTAPITTPALAGEPKPAGIMERIRARLRSNRTPGGIWEAAGIPTSGPARPGAAALTLPAGEAMAGLNLGQTLPQDIRRRIASLPSLTGTSTAATAPPAPSPAQPAARAVAAPSPGAPTPPEPPRRPETTTSAQVHDLPRAEAIDKFSDAVSALPLTDLAMTGPLPASFMLKGGNTLGNVPVAFDRVFSISVGNATVFSTRAPSFIKEVWRELIHRPALQRVDGTPRLRGGVLPGDLERLAAAASNDLEAALDTPADVLDSLRAPAKWLGDNLRFQILAGSNNQWQPVTGNYREAEIIFAECRAANIPCSVTAEYSSRAFQWKKFGMNLDEQRRAREEARAAEATRAEAAALRAEADRVEAGRRR